MHAWRDGLDFHELVLEDPAIAGRVPRAKIERAFDLKRQLRNIDKIFGGCFREKLPRGLPQNEPVSSAAPEARLAFRERWQEKTISA